MITLNGTVKFKSRKIPIFWTGEIAQHVADNFYNDNALHPYQHIEIQQMLAACKHFRKTVGMFNLHENNFVVIPFKLVSNFAVIKTAYLANYNMNTKNKIGSNEEPLIISPGVQACVDDGHYPDAEDLQRYANKIFGGKPTRKKKTTKK